MDEAAWGSPLVAHYTSAAGAEFFDWTDAALDSPSGLARKFIGRFAQIVEAGRGSDWLYAGWYVEMLHLTYGLFANDHYWRRKRSAGFAPAARPRRPEFTNFG